MSSWADYIAYLINIVCRLPLCAFKCSVYSNICLRKQAEQYHQNICLTQSEMSLLLLFVTAQTFGLIMTTFLWTIINDINYRLSLRLLVLKMIIGHNLVTLLAILIPFKEFLSFAAHNILPITLSRISDKIETALFLYVTIRSYPIQLPTFWSHCVGCSSDDPHWLPLKFDLNSDYSPLKSPPLSMMIFWSIVWGLAQSIRKAKRKPSKY